MDDVRALCRVRFGEVPCIRIFALDGILREARDCDAWCPLLNRSIEDEPGDSDGDA